ncbi:MAG: response regulator [Chitinivibrionales bacterium]
MHRRICDSRIIVVDDMPVMTELICMWLSRKGYKNIRCYNDPLQALQHIGDGISVDLVITDYHMGNINGLQMLESISRIHPGVPGIIVSCAPQDIEDEGKYTIMHKNDMLEKLPKIIPHKITGSMAYQKMACL